MGRLAALGVVGFFLMIIGEAIFLADNGRPIDEVVIVLALAATVLIGLGYLARALEVNSAFRQAIHQKRKEGVLILAVFGFRMALAMGIGTVIILGLLATIYSTLRLDWAARSIWGGTIWLSAALLPLAVATVVLGRIGRNYSSATHVIAATERIQELHVTTVEVRVTVAGRRGRSYPQTQLAPTGMYYREEHWRGQGRLGLVVKG